MITKQDEEIIVLLSLCLTLVDHLQQDQKPKSAKWNRLQGLVEGLNRVSDVWGFSDIFAPKEYKKARDIGNDAVGDIGRRIYGRPAEERKRLRRIWRHGGFYEPERIRRTSRRRTAAS